MKKQTVLNWSGGKDASFALHHLLKDPETDLKLLLTTIGKETGRVTMHGVPLTLMQSQAESLQLPFEFIELESDISMNAYNKLMEEKGLELKDRGITHYAFGDIFLEDLKDYRDKQVHSLDIQTTYPLWKRNTKDLANEFISLGFKAIVVAVSGQKLDKSFAGRIYDESFLNDLPEDVDWCGENGEFHTFVFDGPIFNSPVIFEKGEVQTHTYKTKGNENWDTSFHFCDLK